MSGRACPRRRGGRWPSLASERQVFRHTHRGTAGCRCGRPPPWVARPPLRRGHSVVLEQRGEPETNGPAERQEPTCTTSFTPHRRRARRTPSGRARGGGCSVASARPCPTAGSRAWSGNTRGAQRAARAHGEKRLTSRSRRRRSPVAPPLVGPEPNRSGPARYRPVEREGARSVGDIDVDYPAGTRAPRRRWPARSS